MRFSRIGNNIQFILLAYSIKQIALKSNTKALINKLETFVSSIPKKRKETLNELANFIKVYQKDKSVLNLIFVCTHNSRRSQLAQCFLNLAFSHYDVHDFTVDSAGTEVTETNPTIINALLDLGLAIKTNKNGPNPKYQIEAIPHQYYYSKKIDDKIVEEKSMVAIMVCDDADKNCPILPNHVHRFSLTYQDPKVYDNTPQELEMYVKKALEIGSEMLYLSQQLTIS